ncbi:hypothetical protein RJT34_24840 [Clitoria ternatea]|uniref:Pentatricopeptide repeat-containing protein n=1 Tax=Clitoria ternatea TaxID=43366 RepID=A0AAN9FX17_CLITE
MLSTKPKPPTQSSFKLLDVEAITSLLNECFSSPNLIPITLDGHGNLKACKHQDAIDTFRGIGEFGVEDTIALNVLLDALMKGDSVEHACNALSEFKTYGYENDFCKVDQILEQIKGNGWPLNTGTYTIVMLAQGKARQLSGALKVYERMKSDGCVPNPPFYSSLIFILG